MTETRAWRVVAEAFDTPWWQRTRFQHIIADDEGLCSAMDYVTYGRADIYFDMHRMSVAMGRNGCYWWPLDARGARERATFAALMAAMTARERARLVEDLPT